MVFFLIAIGKFMEQKINFVKRFFLFEKYYFLLFSKLKKRC